MAEVLYNWLNAFRKAPAAEQERVIGNKKARCLCYSCPSFTKCAKDRGELLFCLYGRSFVCITDPETCICAKCPVYTELRLKFTHFCKNGAEASQRYEKTAVTPAARSPTQPPRPSPQQPPGA